MYDETLISELAELRATVVATNFMLLTFLEKLGGNPEALLNSVDFLMTRAANQFENQMRKANGLEPREQPRTTLVGEGGGLMDTVDWSKLNEN